ncbi:helix-turn-helix transcriptional regulator [Streptomyces sp. TYQ1024]|nr:helix-turn-helix transcriptional regulator [Streptomyces sp. TYQ1024]
MTDHERHRDEWVADCRLRAATDLFAHTWDPVVLAALHAGPRRRRELRAAIGGISDKVLTGTLHRLFSSGLVDRHAYAEAPPRVDYSLTSLGQSLVEGPMMALGRWAIEHGDELLEAQESAAQGSSDSTVNPSGTQQAG